MGGGGQEGDEEDARRACFTEHAREERPPMSTLLVYTRTKVNSATPTHLLCISIAILCSVSHVHTGWLSRGRSWRTTASLVTR